MSRDPYVGGARSPGRGVRLPTVDRSPSRSGYGGGGGGASPLGGRKPLRQTRSGNNSPTEHYGSYHPAAPSAVPYYRPGDEDLGSPMLEERGRPLAAGVGHHHRSRSATRPSNPMSVRYQSLDRGPTVIDHEREFIPIRDHRRDRSLDRSLYYDDLDPPYSSRSARQSPTAHQPFIGELQSQNSDLQRELGNLKKELELTNQKLGSSMHSIKTFWSPELKKERALRKEESAKYSMINDQLKLLSSENQKQAMLVRQLEEELRMRMRGPSVEMQQQMEALYQENEHLTREITILRDTIKVVRQELELRIETQKQTLQARDESIKKLLEMLQNKGMGKEEERQMFQQMQAMAQKQHGMSPVVLSV
ncbi:ELKS/Rab6-interacting/CAST family member 1-like isoform X2 [Agrilus planipennis]|uniref:ELKS/Rab6-interacting/CAST family member 1-like isoform X2 n=1 Tax=Agrilus planipennis TaxID=224129 RepID=A0A7F5RNN9_AGRPL|nr:ELKS/Rab6-interacting/CAST family member 1-like isoform X2 [Agrilus planipennis]